MFQFEIVSISISASDESREDFDETPSKETAHFWLCAECAASMSLTLDPLSGLRLVPLETAVSDTGKPVPLPRELHDC